MADGTMDELKTIGGQDIKQSTRGILYLCDMNFKEKTFQVVGEAQFDSSFDALNAFANIPNPESQVVLAGKENTFNHMIKEHEQLKKNVKNPKWIEQLAETI